MSCKMGNIFFLFRRRSLNENPYSQSFPYILEFIPPAVPGSLASYRMTIASISLIQQTFKRIIFFLTFFLFTSISVSAQDDYPIQWEEVQYDLSYRSNYLLDVFFLPSNPNYGWICGFGGVVLRTTDAGNSWVGTKIAGANQLESIHFASPNVGYTSGNCYIFKTENGGQSWRNVTPRSATELWGCYFVTDDIGMVIGGGCDNEQYFYRTTNGGISWNLATYNEYGSGLTDLILESADGIGYASSSGKVWKTTNGGRAWSVLSTSGEADWQEEMAYKGKTFLVPYSVSCTGGGTGGVRISTNHGLSGSWREKELGPPMYGSFLLDEQRGWACGQQGALYHTPDGGKNWIKKNCGIQDTISFDDIWFVDDTTGWAVGNGIYRTRKIYPLYPKLKLSGKDTFCTNETVTISTTQQYKYYLWSNGESTSQITVTQSGDYYVIAANSVCDSTYSDTVRIVVYPAPEYEISAVPGTNACAGDSVILSVPSGYDYYHWSDGSNDSSITVKKSGMYSVMIVDNNNCSVSDSVFITIHSLPEPLITVKGRNNFCAGDSTLLTTGDYMKYEWYEKLAASTVIGTSKSLRVKESGNYYVSVTDQYGCKNKSAEVTIVVRQDTNAISINLASDKNLFVFDTTIATQVLCLPLEIRNVSYKAYTLKEAFLYYNIEFSLPLSQFPIVFQPGEKKNLNICFSPVALGRRNDTLIMEDNCSPHYIALTSVSVPDIYYGESECNSPVTLKMKKLANKRFFLLPEAYPKPARRRVNIEFQDETTEEYYKDAIIKMYNLTAMEVPVEYAATLSKKSTTVVAGYYTVTFNNLSTGIYFIFIKFADGGFSCPVIVE